MKPAERQQWILAWLQQRPREDVDVLNAEFVAEYVKATGSKARAQFFGAMKCPQLGRDLGQLHAQERLSRAACGLPAGDASMGFPKWVWRYRLRALKEGENAED